MSNSVPVIKLDGLHTNNSELSEVPGGSLSDCDNLILDKNSTYEQRRGFDFYGNAMGTSPSTDLAKQIFVYKKRILRHFDSKLEFDNGTGTFTAFSGSYSQIDNDTKIYSIERNSNFYFTTADGIKKISAATASDLTSASGFITDAGMAKALDVTLNLNSQNGFFLENSKVAYRIVWGLKDRSNNLILGSPSQRAVIENSQTLSLIKDFNNLLGLLDDESSTSGSDELSDNDYVSLLKIPATIGASAITLRNNLISLASKLENDLNTISEPLFTRTTTSGQLTSNVATINFSSAIPSWVAVGQTITISGLSGALSVFNGNRVITNTGASSIDFSLTNTNIVLTPDTNGTVRQYQYTAITQPATPSINPLATELQALKDYYDIIVTFLQDSPTSKIANPSAFDNSNATSSATVDVKFTIPSSITTANFYQIYRTAVNQATGPITLDDIDAGDEMGLVFEGNPTSAEITSKEITVHDITPDSFRGANLYTNPQSGEGILQANEPPPFAVDIAGFKNHVFFANTKTRHKLSFSLLGITELTSGVSTFSISDGTTTNTFNFASGSQEVSSIQTVADISNSLNNKYFLINSINTSYYVWYNVSGAGTDPAVTGKTGIEVKILTNDTANTVASETQKSIQKNSDFTATVLSNTVTVTNVLSGVATNAADFNTTFTISTTTQGTGENSSTQTVLLSSLPTPAQQVDETARSLVRVINKQTSGLTYAYYLSGTSDVPGQIVLENRVLTGNKFYLFVNDSDTTGISFSPSLPDTGDTGYQSKVTSDNEVSPNRLYYSKLQQPEAVPLVNYIDVGAKDQAIMRIMASRDSLFILKEDGVYRLSGEGGVVGFNVSGFDLSTILLAPNSPALLSNQIYCLANQGVIRISDTGIQVISRPIENQILPLTLHTNFKKSVFGVGYESDRSYLLWTTTFSNDSLATQCFRYNTFTDAWTKWKISKTCGLVVSDKLYLGAGDINRIEKERKNFDRTDYADREYKFTIGTSAVNSLDITMPILTNIEIGDVFTQVQYLTIYKFNQLLEKLDDDNSVSDQDYFSTLEALPGNNLRDKLTDLATKLDNDGGIVYSNFTGAISGYGNSFIDTQNAFNVIITILNSDAGVMFNNYPLSSGTITFESRVDFINSLTKRITLRDVLPVIEGEVSIFKKIKFEATWNVNDFGDPQTEKQVNEAKFFFQHTNFSTAKALFATDVSPSFDELEFNKQGPGEFGYSSPNANFGGFGDKTPFRTLLPRNKQRCRYMIVKFQHVAAREKITLLGYALMARVYGFKAYRK